MTSQTLSRSGGKPDLRYAVHPAKGQARGAVFLTHGYAEHSGRYTHVVDALTARDLIVCTYDLRGHGHSGGVRGFVERFQDYLDDADDLLASLARDDAWRAAGPPVLLGHSLGGLITFHLGLAHQEAFRGAIFSSPFFGLALDVPAPKRLAGQLMSRIVPTFAMPSGLEGRDLTHDPDLARAYDTDPLLVKKVPSRWFTEAMAAQRRALDTARTFMLPTLMLQAGDDRVASVDAARAVFDRMGSKQKDLRVLAGQFHEIFNELERTRWIDLAVEGALRFVTP